MSDFFGRFSSFDLAATPPVWMAGALAAVFLVAFLLAFNRASRDGTGGLARFGLLLVGAGIAWILFDGSARRDLAAERRALDARVADLTVRAIMPGSALACLSAAAGDTVESSCEKALFATPEATAAAVSFVAAQLALLADATNFARRDPNYRGMLAQLRHSAEVDRYGIVAHVLASRASCTADQCEAFALLNDASRVSTNLADRPYDLLVAHYAAAWPAAAESPVAARTSPPPALASAPPAAPGIGLRVPGPNVFFPSAASIPPVNIMNSEPSSPAPETTGIAAPAAKAAPQRKAAAPVRRPVEANPVDISPDPQRAPPPPPAAQ